MIFLKGRTKHSQLALLLPVLFILMTCIVETRGQQAGVNHPSMRDQVRAIQRSDMDRLLLSSTPTPTKKESDSNRAALMKQISEDFRDLQGLNNKMMAEAWARETLDYDFVSDMASRIRGKANRLKLNLNLPEPGDMKSEMKSERRVDPVTDKEFRASLMILDQTIMRFVRNPLFQNPNTIEVTQASQARQDLEAVIQLAAGLKKVASRLGKVGNR